MRRVSILMYHQVGDFKRISKLRTNYCHYRDFFQYMTFLYLSRCSVINMNQLVPFLSGDLDFKAKHCVAITFDDGYEDLCRYVLPVLKRYRFPAMVYLVSGSLGKKAHWLRSDSVEAASLLSLDHIKEMQGFDIEFGAHSVTHPRLTQLNADQALNELVISKNILEENLGKKIVNFCYPYGDHNLQVMALARQVGYEVATTTVKGTATAGHDALALPRKAISFGRGCYRLWRDLYFKSGVLSDSLVSKPILI